MRRIQFFEIEDQDWCPALIRDAMTDFLQFALHVGNSYAPVAPLLRDAVARSGAARIVDLCSGGGGPWLRLINELERLGPAPPVTLTDRFPNREALERARSRSGGRLDYHPVPVDATRLPADLAGFRTLFTAFHHFPPEAGRAILADAARHRQGIGVFEITQRSAKSLLATALSPLLVLLATPAIRPFRWSRLLFTYLIPVIPLAVLFDGILSCLRTWSPAELLALTDGLAGDGYTWTAGVVRGAGPVPVTYLLGCPSAPEDPAR